MSDACHSYKGEVDSYPEAGWQTTQGSGLEEDCAEEWAIQVALKPFGALEAVLSHLVSTPSTILFPLCPRPFI